MNILSKFGKYLTHVVTNVLEKETMDEKYIEYYEHIYKTCSVQFNTDTKNLYRIYTGLLEIIKLDIEILLIRTIFKEIDVSNFELDQIHDLWYTYFNKCIILEDIFIYLYEESKIYIPEYLHTKYNIRQVYIKLWENEIFNKIGLKIANKINDILNHIRLDDSKRYKQINMINLYQNYYDLRYYNLIEFLHKKSIEFYTNLYEEKCVDLESFNKFYTKYFTKETELVSECNFIYKRQVDRRLLVYISDICLYYNVKKIKMFLKNYIENFTKNDICKINNLYVLKHTLNNILPKYNLKEQNNLIEILLYPIYDKINENDIIKKVLKISEIFKYLFENSKYNHLFIDFYKERYGESFIDIENKLNIQMNKLIQKQDQSVFHFIPIIKLLNFEDFSILYKKSLYKRILIGRTNHLFEKQLFCYMKENQLYSNPLKIMTNDIQNEFVSKHNIVIGTKGVWPINMNMNMETPKSFEKCKNEFNKEYKEKYPNRNLYWNTNSINAVIKFKEYEIQIGGIYVDFLNYFNENDNIEKSKICFKTYNKKKIDNLVEIKLLFEDDKFYTINDKFSYNKKKINLL